MDYYSASGMSMLFLVFFQTISISWIFGGTRFCDCVEQMTGRRPSKFFHVCWIFFGPLVMAVSSAYFNVFAFVFCRLYYKLLKNPSRFFKFTGRIFILCYPIHTCYFGRELYISMVRSVC